MLTVEKTKSIIEEGFKLNKSDADIATDLAMAFPEESNESLINSLKTAKKALELSQSINAEKAEQKTAEIVEKKLQKSLEEKFDNLSKTINLNTGVSKIEYPKTYFNFALGKSVELTDAQSESYGYFGKAMNFIKDGDRNNYEAVQREINTDVASKLSLRYGEKVAVSDVAAQGGRLIPIEVADQAILIAVQESGVLSYVRRETVTYNQASFPLMGPATIIWKNDQSTQLTEGTPTIYSTTVTPKDFYAFQFMSNKLIAQRGQNLVDQFIQGIGYAIAKKIDQVVACGAVTANNDGADGLTFDNNTNVLGPVALASITEANLAELVESVIASSDERVALMCNLQVMFALGRMVDAGNNRYFTDFISRGKEALAPYGFPLIINKEIPKRISTGTGALNFTAKSRTSGTETALICADMSKVIVAMSDTLRIDVSDSFRFDYDQRALRVIGSFGQTVASGAATGGIVASVLRLS